MSASPRRPPAAEPNEEAPLFCRSTLFIAALLAAAPVTAQVAVERGTLVRDTVHSEALEGNLLGDPADQPVTIYLPPGYEDEPDRRYPVLYLLHGIGDSPDVWLEGAYQGLEVDALLDSLIGARAIQPMIVVMPNGTNRYVGSFYRDSPVAGGWETYVARDVVEHVDRDYRTIPDGTSRGLAGHSMGGYGAIRMAMHDPERFAAIWAMNPCCLGMAGDLTFEGEGLRQALAIRSFDDFDTALDRGEFYAAASVALASVLSPRPADPPLYVALPIVRDGSDARIVEEVAEEWRAAFPVAEARAHADNLQRLRGFRFDTAFEDEFTHIPASARMFADTLAALEVPHVFEMYEGDHRNRMRERLTTLVLPWFSRLLEGDPRDDRPPGRR